MDFIEMKRCEALIRRVVRAASGARVAAFPLRRAAAASQRRGAGGARVIVLSDVRKAS